MFDRLFSRVCPAMESVEVGTSSQVSADVGLMMSHSTRTAGGSTDDPTRAGASPKHEKQKRKKRKGIGAFFRGIRKAIMRHTLCCNEDDIACSDPTDVQSDLSALDSGLGAAFEKQEKMKKKGIGAFFRRLKRGNKVAPDPFAEEPVALQDPADQTDPLPLSVSSPSALDSGIAPAAADPGPSYYNWTSDPYPDDSWTSPVPGPSGLVLVAKQDPAESQSGSVNLDSQSSLDSCPSNLASELSVLGPSSCEVTPVYSFELTPDMCLADPEPKPIPDAPDVEPVPGPFGHWPATGPLSSFYELKRKLGSGAFGYVYEGTRRFDGQKVAIKLISKMEWNKFIQLPGSTTPLYAEVAVNLLMRKAPKSPHIVQMLDWFDEPEEYALIMEYPHPCETLLKFVMRNGGFLKETVARGLMRQAVLAAKHCIDRGVDHNDIQTENILVNTETLQLKFIDFGCSYLFKTSKDREWVVQLTVKSLGGVLLELVSGGQQLSVLQSRKNLSLSNECKDLINQCLNSYTTSLTLEQMLEHPWFEQD